MATDSRTIGGFVTELSAKVPTPGGGAAAAVSAAIGEAAAAMAAAYTMRKKDIESGAADKATALQTTMAVGKVLAFADADAAAYEELQTTWKATDMPAEQKAAIEARALAVPVSLIEHCRTQISAIEAFLPHCNTGITSDAKVGIHLLAGAARAAYQTAMCNSPSAEAKAQMKSSLLFILAAETKVLALDRLED
ncbi:Cyclodeaminase/cyclohydrolase [Pavlovales sp. CCMP2436]|nr:Cyclodeaminase/cyclohydrolase [Pavlovales sp. CCMP2436]